MVAQVGQKLKPAMAIPDEFTIENDALTPTMKFRRVIETRYRREIDELYAQAEATAIP
jgi:long-subunit acyl-CoA synthetase (AMP-forming)